MDFQYMDPEEDMNGIMGGDVVTADGYTYNLQDMPLETRLNMAEQANFVYREEVKKLQAHIDEFRQCLQEKQFVIDNLIARYNMGSLEDDPTISETDQLEDREMRRKAEALAQRTFLENFELRGLVNELREENNGLRIEIYDLTHQLNVQALHINKLTKNANSSQPYQPAGQWNYENQPLAAYDTHPDALTPEAQRKREEREQKHARRQSSIAQPNDFFESQNPEEEDGDVEPKKPANEVLTTKEMFGREEDLPGNEEEEEEENYMDDAAKKKREERQEKAHERKSTFPTPENFFDTAEPTDDGTSGAPLNSNENAERPAKRRGSKQLDGDPRETEEAKAKRQERYDKEHNRQESGAIPSTLFESNYANSEEAKKVREERAKKARKESVAVPKAFLNAEDADSEDDASREKRRKHQRKQSLMKVVGHKGHLSDEDTEKTQMVDYEARRKLDRNSVLKGKDPPILEQTETPGGPDMAKPPSNLIHEDPAVTVTVTVKEEEIKNLKEKLTKIEEEKKLVEKQLQENKQESEKMEQKLTQQLEKRIEEKFQKEKTGLLENSKKEMEQMNMKMNELKNQLNQTANSKLNLIHCTNNEINRLNRIINSLLQNEKCKEITLLLLDDSTKLS